MAGSGYGTQQHYHNGGSSNNNNNSQQTPVGDQPYIPHATFAGPDDPYTSSSHLAAGNGNGNGNNTFPSSTTLPPPPNTNTNININNHGGYNPDFPSAPFSSHQTAANQHLSANPSASSTTNWPPSDGLFDLNNVELFAGFDIPFWLDDEQYVPFLDG